MLYKSKRNNIHHMQFFSRLILKILYGNWLMCRFPTGNLLLARIMEGLHFQLGVLLVNHQMLSGSFYFKWKETTTKKQEFGIQILPQFSIIECGCLVLSNIIQKEPKSPDLVWSDWHLTLWWLLGFDNRRVVTDIAICPCQHNQAKRKGKCDHQNMAKNIFVSIDRKIINLYVRTQFKIRTSGIDQKCV